MSQKHLPQNWIQKLCVLLSIPGWISGDYYHQIIRFFTAWADAEGGTAEWNPLNTTNHISDLFGAWQGVDYNSVHVANYNNPWQGIVATAATILENQAFSVLLGALRTAEADGLTAEQLVKGHEAAIKTWGTNPDTILSVLAGIK